MENWWLPEVGRGMGEIGEGNEEYTYHNEHWVMYGTVESLYCTGETNITLYVNYNGITFLLLK